MSNLAIYFSISDRDLIDLKSYRPPIVFGAIYLVSPYFSSLLRNRRPKYTVQLVLEPPS
ncbi:hypothetical protein EV361DRAFT_957217 [Lentinula raphanica]|nr:hypothetical protein EV361DRAFT_957217 [Lentinula raphanica]